MQSFEHLSVRLVAPDLSWVAQFTDEATLIRNALSDPDIQLHHIGSTAISGIFAKPIIDLLLVLKDVSLLDDLPFGFLQLGYEAMGEFGLVGRRYFRKSTADGTRTHHLHAFPKGSEHVVRHLAFRDYMNAHPIAAQAYSALKVRLSIQHPYSIEAYMDGKDHFVKAHEQIALSWRGQAMAR